MPRSQRDLSIGAVTPRSIESPRDRWNRRYAAGDPHGTTTPNEFLAAEIEVLPPGSALDLACGAGRNAVWLAERGWRVTAVDFSSVALGRARELASARQVAVEWIEADVLAWTPPARHYDLVTMLYLQLPTAERRVALRRAAESVRPGGTLLVVGHDLLNLTEGWAGPSQPDVLFTPDDIVAELAEFEVAKAERVRRRLEDNEGIHEAIDALIRVQRPTSVHVAG
jgi:ubiquinone/menaquinone biosynthesis C-methylase UbiE